MSSYLMGETSVPTASRASQTRQAGYVSHDWVPLKSRMIRNVNSAMHKAGSPLSAIKMRKMVNFPAAELNQSSFAGDEMMGAFLPGLFSAKLASKTLAKFDPTAKQAKYGKVIRAGVIGGLSLVPVVGLGLSAAASAGFALKANADANKSAAAIQQQVIQNAMVPTPESPEVGPAGEKKSSIVPLLGIGAAAIAALTML